MDKIGVMQYKRKGVDDDLAVAFSEFRNVSFHRVLFEGEQGAVIDIHMSISFISYSACSLPIAFLTLLTVGFLSLLTRRCPVQNDTQMHSRATILILVSQNPWVTSRILILLSSSFFLFPLPKVRQFRQIQGFRWYLRCESLGSCKSRTRTEIQRPNINTLFLE